MTAVEEDLPQEGTGKAQMIMAREWKESNLLKSLNHQIGTKIKIGQTEGGKALTKRKEEVLVEKGIEMKSH